jgi:hypothetical protein
MHLHTLAAIANANEHLRNFLSYTLNIIILVLFMRYSVYLNKSPHFKSAILIYNIKYVWPVHFPSKQIKLYFTKILKETFRCMKLKAYLFSH